MALKFQDPGNFPNCETFVLLRNLIGAALLRSRSERLCDLSKVNFTPARSRLLRI